jgi:hypothetical protein
MPVDISTAELRTMLRAHPGRKRDGTARTRGEQAIRTIMSAITTHYRRVHGVDSASLGDLTWLTSASLSVRSASPTEGRQTPLPTVVLARLLVMWSGCLISPLSHMSLKIVAPALSLSQLC